MSKQSGKGGPPPGQKAPGSLSGAVEDSTQIGPAPSVRQAPLQALARIDNAPEKAPPRPVRSPTGNPFSLTSNVDDATHVDRPRAQLSPALLEGPDETTNIDRARRPTLSEAMTAGPDETTTRRTPSTPRGDTAQREETTRVDAMPLFSSSPPRDIISEDEDSDVLITVESPLEEDSEDLPTLDGSEQNSGSTPALEDDEPAEAGSTTMTFSLSELNLSAEDAPTSDREISERISSPSLVGKLPGAQRPRKKKKGRDRIPSPEELKVQVVELTLGKPRNHRGVLIIAVATLVIVALILALAL